MSEKDKGQGEEWTPAKIHRLEKELNEAVAQAEHYGLRVTMKIFPGFVCPGPPGNDWIPTRAEVEVLKVL